MLKEDFENIVPLSLREMMKSISPLTPPGVKFCKQNQKHERINENRMGHWWVYSERIDCNPFCELCRFAMSSHIKMYYSSYVKFISSKILQPQFK